MPVVVLNKCDLCPESPAGGGGRGRCARRSCSRGQRAPGDGPGRIAPLDRLRQDRGLPGPLGVGKSMLNQPPHGPRRRATADVREKRPRRPPHHNWREMILLDTGGMVIDTPGMREIQLWGGGEGVAAEFQDIERSPSMQIPQLSARTETGCAVLAAVAASTLDARGSKAIASWQRRWRTSRESRTQKPGSSKRLGRRRCQKAESHQRDNPKNW